MAAVDQVASGTDWMSTHGPARARAAATGEPVVEDLAYRAVDAEIPVSTTAPVTQAEALPLGFDWRAHRLFDPSKEPLPESPAVMRVVVVDQVGASGLVPGYRVVPDYSKFFLQAISEQDMEKAHIVETFGSFWVHIFGRKPRVFSFSGLLLSGPGENWEAAWDMLYDRYLRGTRCVEMGTQAQLTYGGHSVYGYVLGMNKSIDAVNDKGVPFSFSMVVAHVEWLAKDRIVQAQFGVENIDGLVALGDLQSFAEVEAEVARRDASAGATIGEMLDGTAAPAGIFPEVDQDASIATALAQVA